MDNKIFNINGSGKEKLAKVLELALSEKSYKSPKGYCVDKEKGLILFWSEYEKPKGYNNFLGTPSLETLTNIVWDWLQSEEAKIVTYDDWTYDCDHDGHNREGWYVYCENWGHIGNYRSAIIAIKHAYCWYGK